MGFKSVNVILVIALSFCFIQNVFAKPRDSTAVHENSVVPNNDDLKLKEDTTTKSEPVFREDYKIPGRIPCNYEDATEDQTCLEHCLPKGYTYGICVSHTCSCV